MVPRLLALKIELTARDTDRAVERGDLIIVIDVLSAIGDRGEADELYQRRMREVKINEEMRKSIQKELDALEDAIERADLAEVLRHKLVLEILLE